MKQLLGLHLPVMGFCSDSSSICNNSPSNNKKNKENEKQQQFISSYILSIATKGESLA
jgi:hypothetical protein